MKVRKDPKGRAKPTKVHKDKTKYQREELTEDDVLAAYLEWEEMMADEEPPSSCPERSEGHDSGEGER